MWSRFKSIGDEEAANAAFELLQKMEDDDDDA
jgi:hypothetical protein